MSDIHPTAIVGAGAEIGRDVAIGPYSVVGGEVRLGDGGVLGAHVVVSGRTSIGARCRVHPFAAIGEPPQDLTYDDEPNGVAIGAGCVIREHVTVHAGTARGRGVTEIGDRCLLMAASHVGHDCRLGEGVIVSNNVMLGGHTTVGDHVNIGGAAAIRQRLRIGDYAFISGIAGVSKDVLPFGYVIGYRGRLDGLNLIGLKRSGFSRADIQALSRCYRTLFAEEGTFQERLERLKAEAPAGGPVAVFTAPLDQSPLILAKAGTQGDCS
jgi:UDP-N-acetylglucosamine acyltransferase